MIGIIQTHNNHRGSRYVPKIQKMIVQFTDQLALKCTLYNAYKRDITLHIIIGHMAQKTKALTLIAIIEV